MQTLSLQLSFLYKAIVRSKLVYGSPLYGSTSQAHLRLLDNIHQYTCLRSILCSVKTTPILTLEGETKIPSLFIRFQYLALKFILRNMTCKNEITIPEILNSDFSRYNLVYGRGRSINSKDWRGKHARGHVFFHPNVDNLSEELKRNGRNILWANEEKWVGKNIAISIFWVSIIQHVFILSLIHISEPTRPY